MSSPRTDPGDRGERGDEVVVGQRSQRVLHQPTVRQPLGEVAEACPIFRHDRPAARSCSRVDGKQLGRRRKMPVEERLDSPIVRRVAATESC